MGGGAAGRGPIHLMPRRCLARLPFVAESAGQTQRTDRTLQDALCAIASRGQQDKAIICPDTSLAAPHGSQAARLTAVLPAHHYSGTQTCTILGCRALTIKGQILCWNITTQGVRHHKPIHRLHSGSSYFTIQTSTGLEKLTQTDEYSEHHRWWKTILLNLDFLCFSKTFHIIGWISKIQLEKNPRISN